LSSETVRAWGDGKTEHKCREAFEHKVRECFEQAEVFEDYDVRSHEHSDHYDDHYHDHQYSFPTKVTPECSCHVQNVFLMIIVIALSGALAGFVFKYKQLRRYFGFKNEEFSNNLVI
jgi:hypothetical protein